MLKTVRLIVIGIVVGLSLAHGRAGQAAPGSGMPASGSPAATITAVAPACVVRTSANEAERTLVLSGSGFPASKHALQFRVVRSQATSALFDGEVQWLSTTTVKVDIALIKDLLWADPLLELDVRLIDTTNWPNWQPMSDWSPNVLLGDDQATCAAGFPPMPVLGGITSARIYALIFNPRVNGTTGNIEQHQWVHPSIRQPEYISDVLAASGGTVRHQIVRQVELNAWTPKEGGYTFTQSDYAACMNTSGAAAHCADMTDYAATLNSTFGGQVTSACDLLASGEVNEIFWWGGPWFGFWEYQIVAPGTLCPNVNRTFTVMGFNYERAVAEMLHDLGHRAEQAVGEGIGFDLWDRFDGQRHRYGDGPFPDVDAQNTHCGNVHFAPNGVEDYVRTRDLPVQSDCNDWQNYPNLTGAKQTLNYTDWLGGDSRGEMKWWLSRLPHNPGFSPPAGSTYQVYHNWWKYIYPWSTERAYLPVIVR
jgi:hypothetical protein